MAGVDEAGRGALAGPVTVAAVILDPAHPIGDLDDSKRLTPRQREHLAGAIRSRALAWTVAHRSPAEIDATNILEATRSAMRQSVCALGVVPGMVVSDAVSLPGLPFPWLAEPRADARYCCVAAASILAKVSRDHLMRRLAIRFDAYAWAQNVGYGSSPHLEALAREGPCCLHRRSFAPIRVLALPREAV
ncbi:MAG: ribonuclease HII [Thermoanaerobaculaceae bacterium]|nr:ribonuclease HII [Thermoanaerobaculaceae bacterium]MDI9622537.1 ribonuclease HII [Acidobacteriota bacterium]NLH09863.1 ribonuclease HII [Holophagae bacterium]HPW54560.1 ribonuclease HII [Thermoanaerobaculaceae bacterium]